MLASVDIGFDGISFILLKYFVIKKYLIGISSEAIRFRMLVNLLLLIIMADYGNQYTQNAFQILSTRFNAYLICSFFLLLLIKTLFKATNPTTTRKSPLHFKTNFSSNQSYENGFYYSWFVVTISTLAIRPNSDLTFSDIWLI